MLSTAAGAKPAFFDGPFINTASYNAGAIAVSTGDPFKRRAFDMSKNTQATSLDQDGAGETWTYQAATYDGAVKTVEEVDTVALLNINLRRFKVEYRVAGGSWTIFPGLDYTASDFSGENKIVALAAPIEADEWLLTATHTQGGDFEKAVGLFLPCLLRFQAGSGTKDYDPSRRDNVVTVELADGSIDETRFLRNDADSHYFRSPLLFVNVDEDEKDRHEALCGRFFLACLDPYRRPGDWKICRIVPGSFRAPPMFVGSDRYRVSYTVEEVGGA